MKNLPKVTDELILLEANKKMSAIGTLVIMNRYGFRKWSSKRRYSSTETMDSFYRKFLKQLPKEKLVKIYIETINAK